MFIPIVSGYDWKKTGTYLYISKKQPTSFLYQQLKLYLEEQINNVDHFDIENKFNNILHKLDPVLPIRMNI